MPELGANSLSVVMADWSKAYLIVDKAGIRQLRDPYTTKPLGPSTNTAQVSSQWASVGPACGPVKGFTATTCFNLSAQLCTDHTFAGERFLPRVPYRLRLVFPADAGADRRNFRESLA